MFFLKATPSLSVADAAPRVSASAEANPFPVCKQTEMNLLGRIGARMLAKRLHRLVQADKTTGRKCAVILKQDGTEIFAHIMTKDRKKVTYKPCGQPKGRSITLATDSIRAIRLPDDLLWEPVPERGYVSGRDKAGNASLILGILSWVTAGLGIGFFLAIAGLATGIVSLRRKYKRKGAAIAGIVLSSLLLLIALIAVVFLFLFWGL